MIALAVLVWLADPAEHPTLRWDAPAECPSEAEVVARTEGLLGQPLADYERTLDVRAEVEHASTPAESRWRVRLVLGERVRELEAGECETLADAVALIVAGTIDPTALDHGDEPEPTPEPAPELAPALEPAPAPEPAPEPSPPVEAPKPAHVSGLIRLGGGLLLGPLPGLAGTPSLSVGLDLRALRIAMSGSWALSRPARYAAEPGVGVEVSLGWATLHLCGVPQLAVIELPICVGIRAGGMRGRAVGIERPGIETLPWLAFEAGAGVVWTNALGLGPFVEVAAVVPALRPGFAVDGAGVLHRADPVGVRVIAGLELRVPAIPRARTNSRDGNPRARPRRGR